MQGLMANWTVVGRVRFATSWREPNILKIIKLVKRRMVCERECQSES